MRAREQSLIEWIRGRQTPVFPPHARGAIDRRVRQAAPLTRMALDLTLRSGTGASIRAPVWFRRAPLRTVNSSALRCSSARLQTDRVYVVSAFRWTVGPAVITRRTGANVRWNAPAAGHPGRAPASRGPARRQRVGMFAAWSASADRSRADSRCTPCSAGDSEGRTGSRGARTTPQARPGHTVPPQARAPIADQGACWGRTTSLPMILPPEVGHNHLTARTTRSSN